MSNQLSNATYVNWHRLHKDIPRFCDTLPDDTIGLIGIPRSGIMVASLMGLHMNLPVGDVESFVRIGSLWSVGRRFHDQESLPDRGTYVLVDDSLNTGKSMQEYRDMAADTMPQGNRLCTAAMYVTAANCGQVDYWGEQVPMPRAFAWNWHAKRASQHWMLDIDETIAALPGSPFRPLFPFG